MKDCNGLEFKVGCVIDSKGHQQEVLKVLSESLVTISLPHSAAIYFVSQETIKRHNIAILHYRELAPDKNGKMICEGDTVKSDSGCRGEIRGYLGPYLHYGDSFWSCPNEVTFVSRPTDAPSESDKKKAELLAKADELIAKANEMKIKAEEM